MSCMKIFFKYFFWIGMEWIEFADVFKMRNRLIKKTLLIYTLNVNLWSPNNVLDSKFLTVFYSSKK